MGRYATLEGAIDEAFHLIILLFVQKGFHKHKLLFDENMPHRLVFPCLNKLFDVKHVRDDLHCVGLSDPQVYALATTLNRIVVTLNSKDFRELVTSQKAAGVIGISPRLSWHHIDTKLTALLIRKSEKALLSKYTPISETAA